MSQSLSQLWVHIIFSTQKRKPFLKDPSIREKLYRYMEGVCKNLNCNPIIINGIEDHIHLLIGLNKNISVSHIVNHLKVSSSKWLKTLDQYYLNEFHWQKGYGAFSVNQSNLDVVIKYINNQEHHHRFRSFQDEFRKFLISYNLAYKEEYVWD